MHPWSGLGHFQSKNHIIYYSRHKNHRKTGIFFTVGKNIAKLALGYNMMAVQIYALMMQKKKWLMDFIVKSNLK